MKQILQGLYICKTYDRNLTCFPSTRESVLGDIYNWENSLGSPSIFWLYGISGSGKTAIAHTVAAALDLQGKLGATFYCNRYEAYTRDPQILLSTIAYQIASRYKPLRLHLEQ
jgi:ABC-type glutathione transport system ATPase component